MMSLARQTVTRETECRVDLKREYPSFDRRIVHHDVLQRVGVRVEEADACQFGLVGNRADDCQEFCPAQREVAAAMLPDDGI